MIDWNKELDSYKNLENTLEKLSEDDQGELMVPFGPLAYIPGHYVDRKKILVLLGGDWWANVDTSTARKIIDHRKQVCEENMKKCEESKQKEGEIKEPKQKEDEIKELKNSMDEKNSGAITEHLSSNEYKKSEDEHRKMVLRQRQRIKGKQIYNRKKQLEESNLKSALTDEELMARLDALELEETGPASSDRSFSPLRMKYKSSANILNRSKDEDEIIPSDLYEVYYKNIKLKKSVSWKESLVDESKTCLDNNSSEDPISNAAESHIEPNFDSKLAVTPHVFARDTSHYNEVSKNNFTEQEVPRKRVSIFKASRKKNL